jgi:hypothetical protein
MIMENSENWSVERRSDGAVIVRVASRQRAGQRIPDAVFAFRSGDPQYGIWEQRLRDLESRRHGS